MKFLTIIFLFLAQQLKNMKFLILYCTMLDSCNKPYEGVSENANYGETISISCNYPISCGDIDTIAWYKIDILMLQLIGVQRGLNEQMPLSAGYIAADTFYRIPDSRFFFTSTATYTEMRIKNLQRSDDGPYFCTVNYKETPQDPSKCPESQQVYLRLQRADSHRSTYMPKTSRDQNRSKSPKLDFGLLRGDSAVRAAKHKMGLEAARHPQGPGRK